MNADQGSNSIVDRINNVNVVHKVGKFVSPAFEKVIDLFKEKLDSGVRSLNSFVSQDGQQKSQLAPTSTADTQTKVEENQTQGAVKQEVATGTQLASESSSNSNTIVIHDTSVNLAGTPSAGVDANSSKDKNNFSFATISNFAAKNSFEIGIGATVFVVIGAASVYFYQKSQDKDQQTQEETKESSEEKTAQN